LAAPETAWLDFVFAFTAGINGYQCLPEKGDSLNS
jgi:hypothetical protein